MINQRKPVFALVTMLFLFALAGCTPSTVQVPTRPIAISNAAALDAQNAGITAFASGKVEWTENQFSSLLSEMLTQHGGHNLPISAIHAWFEPNNEIYLQLVLKEKVLRAGDTVDLKGTVDVQHNHVVVNLQQAGAGNMSVSAPMLTMVNAQINRILADANLGVAAKVKTEAGKLTLQIGS